MATNTGADLVAVGTSSVKIIEKAQAEERQQLVVRNSSTGGQVITLFPANNQVAVANKGIVLSVGQAWVEANSEGFECWQGEIQAISNSASGQVSLFVR